jgi:hypothetical protein
MMVIDLWVSDYGQDAHIKYGSAIDRHTVDASSDIIMVLMDCARARQNCHVVVRVPWSAAFARHLAALLYGLCPTVPPGEKPLIREMLGDMLACSNRPPLNGKRPVIAICDTDFVPSWWQRILMPLMSIKG